MPDAKVLGLDHVQLAMPAGGESQAREFYFRILGMTELEKPPELAKRGGAWFRCGSLQLHLGIDQDFRAAKKAHPAFRVSGFDALLSELRGAGFDVIGDAAIEGVRRAFTADPFGNRIELIDAGDAA